MREYRPGEAAELLGVSVDTVRRWCDEGRLSTRRVGDHRLLDGPRLAAFLVDQSAGDADAASGLQPASARNRLRGIVTRVVRDKVTAQVEVQCGPHRIVSLMTREAADELALEPGEPAVAAVKATNVVIELPK